MAAHRTKFKPKADTDFSPFLTPFCAARMVIPMNPTRTGWPFGQTLGAFFTVGALGGAMVGLVERIAHPLLTKGPILGPVPDWVLSALLFAGFYACLYGALGIVAALVLGWMRPLWSERRPAVLAAILLVFEVALLYASVPINRRLPPISHPTSMAVNLGLVLGATVLALLLFRVAGKAISARLPEFSDKTKIRLFGWAVALCVCGVLVAMVFEAREPKKNPLATGRIDAPNVLLVSVDTLRADHLPAYGYPHIRTPAVDRLAQNGTVFENIFSTSSWTLPACATLATGRTPRANHVQLTRDTLPDQATTLAQAMRQSGRATVGISANRFVSEPYGFARGFDRFWNVYDRDLRPGLSGLYLFDHLHRLSAGPDDAANVNRLVFDQLRDLVGRSWFLWVHYMDPHKPYGGPWPLELPDYDKGYDGSIGFVYGWKKPVNELGQPLTQADLRHVRALYDADIVRFDRHFTLLLDRMETLGLLDNTLIVFVSDHGEEFLEHGDFEHGANLFREQTHVPLIIVGPNVPQGVRVPQRASILDVPRTLCALAGVPAPDSFAGAPLFPLANLDSDRETFGELQAKVHHLSLRYNREDRQRALLINDLTEGRRQWFDTTDDPAEATDLSKDQPEAGTRGFERLQAVMQREDGLGAQVDKGEKVKLPDYAIEQIKALGYIVQ